MKLYGLIGYPLGHSFSKQYFTEKFEREGISDSHFESYPIPTIEEFPNLLAANPQLLGLGVTIPYKEQVLQFVTEQSDEVKKIGATNSIKISGNKLIAYNTDIIGFEQSFCKRLEAHHTKALILGTGGASKAVQYVLEKLGIEFLIVTRQVGLNNNSIHYDAIDQKTMADYTVIVNCMDFDNYYVREEVNDKFLELFIHDCERIAKKYIDEKLEGKTTVNARLSKLGFK